MKKLLTFISNHSVPIIVSILLIMSIALIALVVIGSNFGRSEIYSLVLTILLGILLALVFNFLIDAEKPIGEKPDEKK